MKADLRQGQNESGLSFAARLRDLMDEHGYSAASLARALAVSHVAVGNYLKGAQPSADMLLKISEVFRVFPAWLLAGKGPRDPGAASSLVLRSASAIANESGLAGAEKQRVFEAAERVLRPSMYLAPGDNALPLREEAHEDWRDRALAAERKLKHLKKGMDQLLKES